MKPDEINLTKGKMKLLRVETEIIDGNMFLHFIYDYKDSYKKGDLHLVCYLPASVNRPLFDSGLGLAKFYDTRVDLGLDSLHVKEFRLENVEYDIKEMTIEEIEEKLGHKIKIVGENK